jgi:CubicO group peptidase (beta-lactamase class C family)
VFRNLPVLPAVLLAAAISHAITQAGPPTRTIWPTGGWTKATPESQGISAAAFARLEQQITSGAYGNIDRMLVTRGGFLVIDGRYSRDYRQISRGQVGPLGCGEGCRDPSAMHQYNYYHPDWHPYHQGHDLHTLQSVTKSITATVIGTAVARGRIARLDVPFLSFFERGDLSRIDRRLRRATVEDLLTMRSGIEWHETDRPLDETNTTYQLEKSHDWIQFTLDQPMDADPGAKWAYNSGGSQLLSEIIRAATGQHIDRYAVQTLFDP